MEMRRTEPSNATWGRQRVMRRRAEIIGRFFAHNLRSRRHALDLAGHNLGIFMRLLIGVGTPREQPYVHWPICSDFSNGLSRGCGRLTGISILDITPIAGFRVHGWR